jgi:mono/diheme cytochrome c family protein
MGLLELKASPLTMMLCVLALAGCGTTPPAPAENLSSESGPETYQRFCASCHGAGAQGDGPVAPLVKGGVPDLTRIAARNGGEFPADRVRQYIDGRADIRAHGPRDMPVWGWQFYEGSSVNDAQARARVDATIGGLVDYLRSIQRE